MPSSMHCCHHCDNDKIRCILTNRCHQLMTRVLTAHCGDIYVSSLLVSPVHWQQRIIGWYLLLPAQHSGEVTRGDKPATIACYLANSPNTDAIICIEKWPAKSSWISDTTWQKWLKPWSHCYSSLKISCSEFCEKIYCTIFFLLSCHETSDINSRTRDSTK